MTTEAPTIKIRLTTVAEMRERGGELFLEHWREVCGDIEDLDIQWDRYLHQEAEGVLRILGAWDGDELHGYVVSYLTDSTFVNGRRELLTEGIFARENARKAGLGTRLLIALEGLAVSLDCHETVIPAAPDSTLEKILPRRGWKPKEVFWGKEL